MWLILKFGLLLAFKLTIGGFIRPGRLSNHYRYPQNHGQLQGLILPLPGTFEPQLKWIVKQLPPGYSLVKGRWNWTKLIFSGFGSLTLSSYAVLASSIAYLSVKSQGKWHALAHGNALKILEPQIGSKECVVPGCNTWFSHVAMLCGYSAKGQVPFQPKSGLQNSYA